MNKCLRCHCEWDDERGFCPDCKSLAWALPPTVKQKVKLIITYRMKVKKLIAELRARHPEHMEIECHICDFLAKMEDLGVWA